MTWDTIVPIIALAGFAGVWLLLMTRLKGGH